MSFITSPGVIVPPLTAGGVAYGTGSQAKVTAAGTAKQFLQSNGAGVPTFVNASAPIATDIALDDYTLTLPTAISAAASAPVMSAFALDSDRELMLIARDLSLQAVVWDNSTKTFGTVVLLRLGTFSAPQNFAAVVISSSSVLISSLPLASTSLQTVVLSISGSSINVNTLVATTLTAASFLIAANTRFVTCGSSYILNYCDSSTSQPRFRAITVSGTTPTIGSELVFAGGTTVASTHSYPLSSTSFISLSADATTIYAFPISVSGTTLTGGTAATVTSNSGTFVSGLLSTNNVAIAYATSSTVVACSVVSVTSNIAAISTAATTLTVGTLAPMMQVFSNKAFILTGATATAQISVITDTAGVATVGTGVTVPTTVRIVGFLSTEKVLLGTSDGSGDYYQYGISSGAAVLEKTFPLVFSNTLARPPGAVGTYTQPISGPPSSNETKFISVRTSSGKVSLPAVGTSTLFTASFDGTNIAKVQQATYTVGSIAYNDAISSAVAWALIPNVIANGTNLQLRRIELT